MSLLTVRAPVDYVAQQGTSILYILLCTHVLTFHPAAFEDFLQSYKSTATELEELGDLNLEDVNQESHDDTSDEYDMLDDVAGGKEARQSNKFKTPKHKYMDILQRVADRRINEVCIELDDLDNVRIGTRSIPGLKADEKGSMREPLGRTLGLNWSNRSSKTRNIILIYFRKRSTRSCRKKLVRYHSKTTFSTL